MATLTTQALGAPFAIDGTKVRAEFTADGTVGVKWSLFRDKVGGNFDYTPNLDDTATHDTFNGGLWLLDCAIKPSEGDKRVFVGPEDAGSFTAYTISGVSDALLMEWRDIAVPGAPDGDTLWVRVLCQLEDTANDDGLRWYGWFGRASGASVSGDFFCYPRTILQQTVTVGAGTAEQASQRCRFLMPLSGKNGFDTFPNADMRHRYTVADTALSSTTSGYRTVAASDPMGRQIPPWNRSRYPNVFWQMQFAALCACKADEAEYLRTFYTQAEDGLGYAKYLDHRVIDTSGSDRYMMMAVNQFVPHESGFDISKPQTTASGTAVRTQTEWANEYGPFYKVQTAAFTAASADWWYDVTERYRTWYEGAYSPPIYQTNPNGGPTRTDPLFLFATIQLDSNDTAGFATQIATLSSTLKRYMRSTLVGDSAFVFHLQTYWQDSDGVLFRGVDNMPLDGSPAPGITTSATLIHDRGWKFSVHHDAAEVFTDGYFPTAPGIATFRGGQYRSGGSKGLFDRGTPATDELFDNLISFARGASAANDAIYLDGFSGNRITLYNPRGGDGPLYRGNTANEFTAGKQAFLNRARSVVTSSGIVAAEGVEEGLYGADWQGMGYAFYPQHLLLGDSGIDTTTVFGLSRLSASAATDPPSARNLVPPLWNAVHHEWIPGGVLGGAFNSTPLATNTRYHAGGPGGSTDAGMTDAQFRASEIHNVAVNWSQGAHALCFSFFHYDVDPQLDLDLTSNDSGGMGAVIWAFLKDMWEALREDYAGQYLRFGRMRRPLQVDYTSADVERVTNPSSYWQFIKDWDNPPTISATDVAPSLKQTLAYANAFTYMVESAGTTTELRWGNNAFQVPKVYHSVWENRTAGDFGIVFVNWDNSTAAFRGTFDPTLYGITGTYEVDRLDLGDPTTVTNLATGQSGSKVLGWGGGAGKDIDLGGGGEMPAESVFVVRITEN